MKEGIKNWIIGGLIAVIVILGFILKNQTQTIPTHGEITPTSNITFTGNCISAEESWTHIGEETCVEFYVSSPFRSGKGNIFLNERKDYKNGFTVWIPAGSVGNFQSDPIVSYGYKTIQVKGQIRMYQGHPEIIANSPEQIIVK
jgi:hypothetical protein